MWDKTAINQAALGPLSGKRMMLGVSGGISAYKSLGLVRLLTQSGAEVQVVMTPGAQSFIQPWSFQALSGRRVRTDLWDASAEAAMGHIELAKWADAILIVPATANIIAKLAHGMADDLLTTLCLASNAPMAVAPAMNQQMWAHPAVQANIQTLKQRGYACFGPGEGAQACGDWGEGRMIEPMALMQQLSYWLSDKPAKGRRCLITAGPTREAIDPVRFISNHSSGKMGYALAAAACQMGFDTYLVSGPVDLDLPIGVNRVMVDSATQMLEKATEVLDSGVDLIIGCAAVADVRPAAAQLRKLAKQDLGHSLAVIENPDVIATLARKSPGAFKVGFAAQMDDALEPARDKMRRKGLDLIIANDISQPALGMNADNNQVQIIKGSDTDPNAILRLGPTSKTALGRQLLSVIWQLMS